MSRLPRKMEEWCDLRKRSLATHLLATQMAPDPYLHSGEWTHSFLVWDWSQLLSAWAIDMSSCTPPLPKLQGLSWQDIRLADMFDIQRGQHRFHLQSLLLASWAVDYLIQLVSVFYAERWYTQLKYGFWSKGSSAILEAIERVTNSRLID